MNRFAITALSLVLTLVAVGPAAAETTYHDGGVTYSGKGELKASGFGNAEIKGTLKFKAEGVGTVKAPAGINYRSSESGTLWKKTDGKDLTGLGWIIMKLQGDHQVVRVEGLATAFDRAIAEYGYEGRFRGVYPIKVNQQRHLVEEMVQFGANRQVGLEAGSKPELLIALALLDTPDALLICNGYKDKAYIELALLAQKLGRTPVVVIDRFSELDLVIKTSRELGIRPHLGLRARLTTRGAGKWVESTGDRSKFGLSAVEIVNAVERLRSEDMLECLELLHFHIGSQITAITTSPKPKPTAGIDGPPRDSSSPS